MNNHRELQTLRTTGAVVLFAGLAAVFFSILTLSSHRQLREAEDNRHQAYLLTEQLRLSSDNLTMMARAYVSTGEARFKDYFHQIVAIRDGKAPRPLNYHRVYWDLKLVGFEDSIFGPARALDDLMVSAGISDTELELLRRAKAESDTLTNLENRAFNAIEGHFLDTDGSYSINAAPDRSLALQLLYSPEYFQAKARIMGYINHFYEKMESRTGQRVKQLDASNQTYTLLALFCFSVLIAALLVHAFLRNRLQNSWVSQLQAEIDHKTADLSARNEEYRKTIEELRDARNQLLESEKFSTLGNLVSSVTHEINTPLSVGITASTHAADTVRKLCDEYQQNTLSNSRFQQYLDSIQSGMSMVYSNLDRVSKLMGSFKQISVDQSLDEKRKILLADYVHSVVITLLPKFRRSAVTLIEDIPADIQLFTEPGALAQVLTNILVNAYIHAFPEDRQGHIRISATKSGDTIELVIEDDGIGMDSDISDNIYQAFFTTKRDQGGTGLGMNIAYNLVTQRLGGQLNCTSQPEKGSSFFITLPEQLASNVVRLHGNSRQSRA